MSQLKQAHAKAQRRKITGVKNLRNLRNLWFLKEIQQ
jgi:hypothetical protein